MSQIELASLIVVVIVVVCYGLAFFLSFKRSAKYQIHTIRHESMDQEIGANLIQTDCDYFGSEAIPQCCSKKGGHKKYNSLAEYRNMVKFKEKRVNRFVDILTWFFYAIFIVLFAAGIYLRVTGDNLFIGNNSYIIIETGSMSAKNTANDYLFNEDLAENYTMDNQIQVFDMIQLEKVDEPSDIKLYDVVAYRTESGAIIVHRVIEILDEDGVTYFRFRGDANSASSDFEYHGLNGKGLTLENIVGKYTGWHSFGLGVTIDYLRSDIGIICLTSAIIVVLMFYAFDEKVIKKVEEKENELTEKIDEGKDVRYKWYNIRSRETKGYQKLTKGIYIDDKEGR